jgi:hypothetical protein
MAANASARQRAGGRRALGNGATIREGLLAGLIGAAVVALWFLVLDMVIGRLLFTPAALGSALFLGVEGPGGAGDGGDDPGLHLRPRGGVSRRRRGLRRPGGPGVSASPSVLMAVILLFVVTLTLAMGLMAILASWVLAALSWWAIAIGNLLAAAAMAAFLWKRHPNLARRLGQAEEQGAAEEGTAGPSWRGPGPAQPGEEPRVRPRGPSTPEGGERV